MGQDVKVTLPLQRFDYDAVQALKAFPGYSRTSLPGTMSYLDIGSLLLRNGKSFELWIKNGFWGTANQAAYPDLPPGTYFLACNVAGIVGDNKGRDAELITVMIEANWVQAHPVGPLLCYSQDPAYFRNLPVVG
jgi:hypothetical protein